MEYIRRTIIDIYVLLGVLGDMLNLYVIFFNFHNDYSFTFNYNATK